MKYRIIKSFIQIYNPHTDGYEYEDRFTVWIKPSFWSKWASLTYFRTLANAEEYVRYSLDHSEIVGEYTNGT